MRRAAVARLAALGALAGPAASWGLPEPNEAPSAVPLVWGLGGVWAAGEGRALQALDGAFGAADAPAAPVAPVATASGIWGLTAVGELRAWRKDGQDGWPVALRFKVSDPVHGLAASADGRWVMVAHGEQLSLLDAQAQLVRRYDGSDLTRRRRGRAQALWHLPQRRSFVVSWPTLGELWEIALDPSAEPIFDGLVHDYRMGEGLASPGYLGLRRTPLGLPMPELVFADARMPWVAGLQGGRVVVVHLDVRRRIAELALPDARPQAALLRRAAAAWQWWLPCGSQVQVLDLPRFALAGRYELPAPVRALWAVGTAVWALLGDAHAAALWLWDGDPWRPLGSQADASGEPGVPLALAVEPGGARVLLATGQPAAVYLLAADGLVLERWPLPAGADLRGVAWLSAAS